jgi:O-antigen ligase
LLGSRANWRVLLRTTLLIAVSGTVLLLLAALLMPEAFADAVNLVALLNRLESIYDPDIQSSNDERAQLLTYAVALGFEHPVFGAGAAQFNCCTADLGFPELAENLHPENIFLHLYSEYGLLPAVTAFLILGLAALHGLSQQGHHQRMAGAALISLIVWLQLNSELPSLFIWTVLGVLCSIAIHVPDSVETESR